MASSDATQEEAQTEHENPNPDEDRVLRNLVVLPPRQKPGTLDRDETLDVVPLPPIRSSEQVAAIRSALSDVVGYAHLTNFRLFLEKDFSAAAGQINASPEKPIVSPYTGKYAVISTPYQLKSLGGDKYEIPEKNVDVLDDFGELHPLLDHGLSDGSGFRVILERYDVASVRDHVSRFRALMDGNAPHSHRLDDEPKSEGEQGDPPAQETQAEALTKKEEETAYSKKEKERLALLPELAGEISSDGNNLKDFYYLASGEERASFDQASSNGSGKNQGAPKSKSKKKKQNGSSQSAAGNSSDSVASSEFDMARLMPKLNDVEARTRVDCEVRMSGFNPPPPFRRSMGDLTYLEVRLPGETSFVHVTAISSGFYVNKSTCDGKGSSFDPSPAVNPCYSHALLDCLLQYSEKFASSWKDALEASKERLNLTAKLNDKGPFVSLFRVAVQPDFPGLHSSPRRFNLGGIDTLIQCSPWTVAVTNSDADDWTKNSAHTYDIGRAEGDLSNSIGIDARFGPIRDWNNELQIAREMPVDNLLQRLERARALNKILLEFGDAALQGVKAIYDGRVAAMNGDEPARSQVFLHNNIFFSRALDSGVDTFKIAKGDRAARKSASRDLHGLSSMHRLEQKGLYTLGTVLIDYLGTRFVCQTILPGILNGDNCHTLVYGAVENGSPLCWNKEMHDLLEESLGESMMIATRKIPALPLTDKRMAEVKAMQPPTPNVETSSSKEEEKEKKDYARETVTFCAPVETKGIMGSDKRLYVLDMTRLTPRDANWVPVEAGGTGRWESEQQNVLSSTRIPGDLKDDEWMLATLRPELVSAYTQFLLSKRLVEQQSKELPGEAAADNQKKEEVEPGSTRQPPAKDAGNEQSKDSTDNEEKSQKQFTLTDEDLAYVKSIRYNVNVFLPDMRSLAGLDDEAALQLVEDEKHVRASAEFLWDEMIPKLIQNLRDGHPRQLPRDGSSLTEFIHRHGVNCRYLGRIASLIIAEEESDRQQTADLEMRKTTRVHRRRFPLCWLELIECEIVARAAKHVLDGYLLENGAISSTRPAQVISVFLSALVSEMEETASQTENRLAKHTESRIPDDDDLGMLTLVDAGFEPNQVDLVMRGRKEIWDDIETEVGRRFRYSLTLYNKGGKKGRALYMPLLRRFCQRYGIRLAAKNYDLGGRCLCGMDSSSGLRLTASYPISPLDILDVVPLMKHAAAHSGGFFPCNTSPIAGLPPLHISLPDARIALENSHAHQKRKLYHTALDLAQEAANLYTRVSDGAPHPGLVRSMETMSSILLEAGQPETAAVHATKSLALAIQIFGFDSSSVASIHQGLVEMLMASQEYDTAVKHMKAFVYIAELMAGQHSPEVSECFSKMGNLYHEAGRSSEALTLYRTAMKKEVPDRIMEGVLSKSVSMVLGSIGRFQEALEEEKKALKVFTSFLGTQNQLTRQSEEVLAKFALLAVEQNKKDAADEKLRTESLAADLIAKEIEAEEESKKKKLKAKKKKGKK